MKGAYGVLRLYCQVPELKTGSQGKEIFDIADKLENGKEGVDSIALLASNVPGLPTGLYNGKIPEFWEFKHYADAAKAVTLRQVQKHLETRVLPYLDSLVKAGFDDEVIEAIMKQVKLRFEVIAPNAAQKTKDDIYDLVTGALQDYPALTRFKFSFDKSDIFVRKGNPLVEETATLAGSL